MINASFIHAIREYCTREGFDCILLYNGVNEEPSFLKPLLQDSLLDAIAAYIDFHEVMFYIPGWFADMASKRYGVSVVGTPTKIHMVAVLYEKLTPHMKKIGLCGRFSYKEYFAFQQYAPNAKLIEVDYDILRLHAIKTLQQKYNIRDIQLITQKIFNTITLMPGMTEKDLEQQFFSLIPSGYAKEFLCITGFENLRDSTIAEPTERVIVSGEVVCVDFGLSGKGCCSDMTRCFFVGKDSYGLYDAYQRIQEVIAESLSYIVPGKRNKEFIRDFIALSEKHGLTDYYLTDLGHGIGNDVHEYPDLYNDDFVFEEGMCFTLEPEYKVNGYFLRYEDIYTIHNGKTILLHRLMDSFF